MRFDNTRWDKGPIDDCSEQGTCQPTRLPALRRRCMLPICFDPGRNHRCPNGRRRSFTPSPGVPDSAAQHGGNPIELPWRRPVWSAIAPGRPQAPRVGVSTHRGLAMAGRCRSPISRSGNGGFANLARQKQPPRALHRTTRSFFDPTLDSSHVTSTSDKPSLRLMTRLCRRISVAYPRRR